MLRRPALRDWMSRRDATRMRLTCVRLLRCTPMSADPGATASNPAIGY
jgi:hydroxyacyl-ACP dehydratase HTD2-like protein with hotdog domain